MPLLQHMQSNDQGYSKRLEQNEKLKLQRQDQENDAIIRSLDIISKRKAESLLNSQKLQTNTVDNKTDPLNPPSDAEVQNNQQPLLGKRGSETFNSFSINREDTRLTKKDNLALNAAQNDEYPTDEQDIEEIKIETVFKQEIYKRNKTKEISKNLYQSDTFALNTRDYKRDYYFKKFGVQGAEYQPFRESLKLYYIEGIVWNYHYYYKGCVSWDWFFPYYYAPLLSDLNNFAKESFGFKMGEPFTPCEQLLAVLPAFSSHALPVCLRELVHKDDSEIIDFYPSDFHIGNYILFRSAYRV